ncbi:MAG: 4-hydroxy-tetrahydrodipicolinate reductase [Phycisphaeraceae bacterium]|nr:4-hydroxy-tetrahydrodipicolinate reductase [Phycisphaeraceae bacterium]
MTTIGINGAAGRMGRRLVALASEDSQLHVGAAMECAGHSLLGQDAGTLAGVQPLHVSLTDTIPSGVEVLIDFTVPAATRLALAKCVQSHVALVIGTTGLTSDDHRAIDEAAKTIAVLQAANMSLGVNLLIALAAKVAKQLGDDYDIEIVEGHHRFKKDAPSGTAMALASAICKATDKDPVKALVHGRHGDDVTRKRGEIGMHALRLGDEVGRHTVSYATLGEELQLCHAASTRDVFARGALKAAKWLAGKPAGRYDMPDVLGLR